MGDTGFIILITLGVAFVAMVLAGLTNKLVVYFDKADFVVSALPAICLITPLILQFLDGWLGLYSSSINTALWYAGGAFAVIFYIWSVWFGIKYNQSLVFGGITGVLKPVAAFVGILVMVFAAFKMFGENSNRKEAFVAVVIGGIFTWLASKLINGEEVYKAKGWELPQQAEETAE